MQENDLNTENRAISGWTSMGSGENKADTESISTELERLQKNIHVLAEVLDLAENRLALVLLPEPPERGESENNHLATESVIQSDMMVVINRMSRDVMQLQKRMSALITRVQL